MKMVKDSAPAAAYLEPQAFDTRPQANSKSKQRDKNPPPSTEPLLKLLFLWLRLIDQLGNNIAIRWSNVCVIVTNRICDFKTKFLVEIDCVFIVCLHVQVNLTDVFLGTKIKDMI